MTAPVSRLSFLPSYPGTSPDLNGCVMDDCPSFSDFESKLFSKCIDILIDIDKLFENRDPSHYVPMVEFQHSQGPNTAIVLATSEPVRISVQRINMREWVFVMVS